MMQDPLGDANTVFRKQSDYLVDEYKTISRAKSFEDVPYGLWQKFYTDEMNAAKADFPSFKKDYLIAAKIRFKKNLKRKPSISLGAAVNLNEDVLRQAESTNGPNRAWHFLGHGTYLLEI